MIFGALGYLLHSFIIKFGGFIPRFIYNEVEEVMR